MFQAYPSTAAGQAALRLGPANRKSEDGGSARQMTAQVTWLVTVLSRTYLSFFVHALVAKTIEKRF